MRSGASRFWKRGSPVQLPPSRTCKRLLWSSRNSCDRQSDKSSKGDLPTRQDRLDTGILPGLRSETDRRLWEATALPSGMAWLPGWQAVWRVSERRSSERRSSGRELSERRSERELAPLSGGGGQRDGLACTALGYICFFGDSCRLVRRLVGPPFILTGLYCLRSRNRSRRRLCSRC
jgi:hypothetical protein